MDPTCLCSVVSGRSAGKTHSSHVWWLTSDWMSPNTERWPPHVTGFLTKGQLISKSKRLREVRWKPFLMTWSWKSHCITLAIQDSTSIQWSNKRLYFPREGVPKAHSKKIMGDRRLLQTSLENTIGHTHTNNHFFSWGFRKMKHSSPRIPWGIPGPLPYQNLWMHNYVIENGIVLASNLHTSSCAL